MTILLHISLQEVKKTLSLSCLALKIRVEIFRGIQKHNHTALFSIMRSRNPMLPHLLRRILQQPLARIGNPETRTFAIHLIKYHKMILVPMQYTRKRSLRQLAQCTPHRLGIQTQCLCRTGEAEHAHPSLCGTTILLYLRYIYITAKIATYHCEAGNATLHRIPLTDQWKTHNPHT